MTEYVLTITDDDIKVERDGHDISDTVTDVSFRKTPNGSIEIIVKEITQPPKKRKR